MPKNIAMIVGSIVAGMKFHNIHLRFDTNAKHCILQATLKKTLNAELCKKRKKCLDCSFAECLMLHLLGFFLLCFNFNFTFQKLKQL